MNLHSNFRYIDEFCFVLSVIYIIFYLCIYRKCEKIYIGMIAVMALMALVGIISNFKSDVERSIYIIVLDIVYFTKDFICFIAAGLYFRRKRVGRGFVNVFTAEIHFILLIAFVCLCISQFVDIGMTRESDMEFHVLSLYIPMQECGVNTVSYFCLCSLRTCK